MGICYKLYLYDDFDWNYVGFNRGDVANQVKAICPHAELIADTSTLMIFAVEKTPPWEFLGKQITCDAMMYTSDNHLTPRIVAADTIRQALEELDD